MNLEFFVDPDQIAGNTVVGSYDLALVGLSYLIATVASYVALLLAMQMLRTKSHRHRNVLLIAGGSSLGGGIWAMHFVGMLAFELNMEVQYDLFLTAISMVLAIASASFAFYLIRSYSYSLPRLLLSGLVIGIGVSSMHYTGMAAMRMDAMVRYEFWIFSLSIVIAICASVAALSLFFFLGLSSHGRSHGLHLVSAMVMGVAVAGMHYTGMLAAVYIPANDPASSLMGNLRTENLVSSIIVVVVLILSASLISSFHQEVSDRRRAETELKKHRDQLEVLIEERTRDLATANRELESEIAERIAAEETVRRSEEVLAKSQELAHIGSWDWELRSDRVLASTEMYRIMGVDRTQAEGTLAMLIDSAHPQDRERVHAALQNPARGEIPEFEYRIVRPAGEERIVRARGIAYMGKSNPGARMIGTVMDVTESRKIEEQLRQAEKLAAVGHLVGGIAHEFNNIHAIIGSYSDLIMKDLPQNDRIREDMTVLKNAHGRAAILVRQLMSFGKKQLLQLESVDIAQCVSKMADELGRELTGKIEISFIQKEPVPFVRADRSAIVAALRNMLKNACESMANGGRLELGLQKTSLDEAFCASHPGTRAGEYVEITISDTGTGMTKDLLQQVFDPFFTTKRSNKGVGLGLSMAYGVVSQMGGLITAHSESGVGSRFHTYLPASA